MDAQGSGINNDGGQMYQYQTSARSGGSGSGVSISFVFICFALIADINQTSFALLCSSTQGISRTSTGRGRSKIATMARRVSYLAYRTSVRLEIRSLQTRCYRRSRALMLWASLKSVETFQTASCTRKPPQGTKRATITAIIT